MPAPRSDCCSQRPLNWWVSMDDSAGFHLCGHHDKASAVRLEAEGYERIESVVVVDGPQTLVG